MSPEIKLRRELEGVRVQTLEFQYNTTRNDDVPFMRELIRRMSLDLGAFRLKKCSVNAALKGEKARQDLLKEMIHQRIRGSRYLSPEAVVTLSDMIDDVWRKRDRPQS